jgi:cellulose synthase/poly-beta-1,6-N-acetylglucosamine synthase-like glycosyltransferase
MEKVLNTRESNTPLGSILMRKGLIREHELDAALAIQKKEGGRIGTILIGQGFIGPQPLAQALSEHHGIPFVDLQKTPVQHDLLRAEHVMHYLEHQAVPYKRMGEQVQIATTDITFDVVEWARKTYGQHFSFIITSPRDIAWCIESHFGTTIDTNSREYLHKYFPNLSTLATLENYEHGPVLLGLALFVSALLFFPVSVISIVFIAVNLLYFATIVFKVILFEKGAREEHTPPPLTITDPELPTYTILIPMYQESATLPHLIPFIRALYYPKSKLDVKLIIESDDHETLEAAKKLEPEGFFHIIRVPYSLPRTKPKACNYALRFARGEYVTIYDAEDRPDPKQLRRVVETFKNLPSDVVCLQARLNYYNRDDNMLTQFFAIEYAAWFDYILKGLESLDIPIPLGGTSNHIALRRLRDLGEWDPYNVTEDADLGVRIARSGLRTAMVHSLTLEEAPNRIGNWMRQRSRWIKGYMQTWLVHMRAPKALLNTFGWRGLVGFHLFIGGPCFVFLSAPFLWVISLGWMEGWWQASYIAVPAWAIAVSLFNLIFGFFSNAWFAFQVVKARQWPHMSLSILCFPLYWLLHSVASFKALWQLIFKPYFWEKTHHGLSSILTPNDKIVKEFQ